MTRQLRSELVKLRSTRTNLGLLGGMIGLVLLIVIVTGLAVTPAELVKEEHQRAMFGLGSGGRLRRRADRRHVDQERVPARHDPADLHLHTQAGPRAHARRSLSSIRRSARSSA